MLVALVVYPQGNHERILAPVDGVDEDGKDGDTGEVPFLELLELLCGGLDEAPGDGRGRDTEGGCGIDDGLSVSSARYAAKGFSEELLREGARLFQGFIEGQGDLSLGTPQAGMIHSDLLVAAIDRAFLIGPLVDAFMKGLAFRA